ncbi:MAG: hypothetical protein COA43_12975 [Robiginitomaculum sp.]|nr:MAG: hypothetical protein COA43_12975 [Robiginitomaculum sp.]
MDIQRFKQMAMFGVMGGLLMLFGDLCFYMSPISGADFEHIAMMNVMPTNRLILGGMVGPLAGLLYGLGSMMLFIGFRRHDRRLARIVSALFVIMLVMGGAYHAVHVMYGFIGSDDVLDLAPKITGLIVAMRDVSALAGVSATLLFTYIVLRYDTVLPKWIVLFTPVLWTLLGPIIAPHVPYPFGGSIIGGWVNICFITFFLLCYFTVREPDKVGT